MCLVQRMWQPPDFPFTVDYFFIYHSVCVCMYHCIINVTETCHVLSIQNENKQTYMNKENFNVCM